MILDTFTQAYLICGLWASHNDDDTPLDQTHGLDDLAPETIRQAVEDCKNFQEANAADLARAGNDEQNGHDFWLTRNHHGAGFWDRGYDKDVAKRLTDAAHAEGSIDFYLGDDNLIYGA